MERYHDESESESEHEEEESGGWLGLLASVVGGLAVGTAIFGAASLQSQMNEVERVATSPDRRTREEYLDTEHDNHVRSARAYLYTSPTEALPNATSQGYLHWAMVFHFEDDAYRTLDAKQDEDGCMYGHYKKVRPVGCLHQIILGSLRTSPLRLWECAKNNVFNSTPYNFTMNNCQTWVLAAAEQLDVNILEALRRIERLSTGVAIIGGMCSAILDRFNNFS